MPGTPLTPDEIVDTLKRSTLPTILVEGTSDRVVYRYLEDRLGPLSGDVLICGGRESLFKVYERRGEFTHINVVFLADQDMWWYSGVPENYSEVLWTLGYCIENDLYEHSGIERLMDVDEAKFHEVMLNALCSWFAFEVEEHLAGREAHVSTHPCKVCEGTPPHLRAQFLVDRGFKHASSRLSTSIRREYMLALRGKQLFQMLSYILSSAKRESKFSYANLVEISLKTPQHPNVTRLIGEIQQRLS